MQTLTPERAIALLHAAPQVGACVFAHGTDAQPELEIWPRQRAESAILAHGALLAGPNAREANFGVCCMTSPGRYVFFETAHT